MKKLKNILQFIIMTCALLLICTGVSARTNSMIDQAHILTATQRTELARTLEAFEKKHNVRMAVITVKGIKGNDMAKYCNYVLDKNFTEGAKGNMLLMVDMAKKNWHISTDKKMEKMLPNTTAIQAIKNNILPHLKKGEFSQAFTKYAVTSDQMLSYYEQNGRPFGSKEAEPAKQKEEKKGFSFGALIGALIFGGLGAKVYGGSLKGSMSNVAEATEADEYLEKDTFKLTQEEDTFLYMTMAAVPKGSRNDDDTDHGDDDHGGDGGSFGDEGSDYDTYDSDSDDGGSFDDSGFDDD